MKSIKLAKKLDSSRAFSATKVRIAVKCTYWSAWHFLFLDHAVGTSKGPAKNYLHDTGASLKNTRSCGNATKHDAGGFHAKREWWSGHCMKSQCYGSTHGVKGLRVLTIDTLEIWYEADEMDSANEARKKKGLEGKNLLLVRIHWFDKSVGIPSSGRWNRTKCKKDQSKFLKKR